jgi:hypothetical protein
MAKRGTKNMEDVMYDSQTFSSQHIPTTSHNTSHGVTRKEKKVHSIKLDITPQHSLKV